MSSSPQPIKNDKSPPVVPIGSGTFASASDPADDNASHPTKGDRPAGRKSRLREKQRLRRQQERELKRAEAAKAESTAAAKQNQAELEEKEKRHRPSPMERSMIFFMKMHDWSGFLYGDRWVPQLHASDLDPETVEAISRVVNRCLRPGERGERVFRSVADLERFVDVKAKEAAYVEKQLTLMPSLQDLASENYFGSLQRQSVVPVFSGSDMSTGRILDGPASFLRYTILPCLKAQVQFLQSRISGAREMYQKWEELQERSLYQKELHLSVESLQENCCSILPICPAWKEVELEINKVKEELMHPNELVILAQEREQVWEDYQAILLY